VINLPLAQGTSEIETLASSITTKLLFLQGSLEVAEKAPHGSGRRHSLELL
jgi:hypothetical protein